MTAAVTSEVNMFPVTLLLVHTSKDQEWSASEAMSSTVFELRSHLSIPISLHTHKITKTIRVLAKLSEKQDSLYCSL